MALFSSRFVIEPPADYLKRLPVGKRPKMIGLFPRTAPYFQEWRTLRWFLLLSLPPLVSGVSFWLRRHQAGGAIFFGFVGVAMDAYLFTALCSGMTSSNWGTYFRDREPIRYWFEVVLLAAVYLALPAVGFLA